MKNFLPCVFLIAATVAGSHFAQNRSGKGATEARQNSASGTFRDCQECPEMVAVPAGTFTMGSPADEKDRGTEEGPQKRILIRRFAAGRFDVTRGEWKAFVAATGRKTASGCAWTGRSKMEADPNGSWSDVGFEQDDKHPVVCVNWREAQEYAAWLSKKTGKKYRLLSEAEWEYAARAGSSTAFWWGSEASHEQANYGAENWGVLAVGRDQWLYTSPVGAFPPNAFGLYDMSGNVLQWVQDCFAADYAALPTDGSAYEVSVRLKTEGDFAYMNQTSSCTYRRVRGGDWGDPGRMIRSAARNWAPPPGWTIENYRSGGVGFRVALTMD